MKVFFKHLALIALTGAFIGGHARAATLTVTPTMVSNTYSGFITLLVTGLTNSEPVVMQKFSDLNTNGVVDSTDFVIQQFGLTEGAATVIGGVTNINVPGDTDTTSTNITAQLNFQNGDFVQNFVGKYLYKLSSPTARFTPITNLFTVTNATFALSGTLSGSVTNSGTNVPNASVILFQPAGDGLNPLFGCVANNSGAYSIKAPPGAYLLVAFKSNYVANFSTAPTITLSNALTVTTNLSLIVATQSISGKIVDAANTNLGLAGMFVHAESTNNLLAIGSTDTNGNFTIRTVANSQWKFNVDGAAVIFRGYLRLQNSTKVNTTTGSVANVTVALPKATALFYGSVKTPAGTPLAGVHLYVNDNSGVYESDPQTDVNGNYTDGVVAGTWQMQVDNNNPNFTNYVFSQSDGQTNLIAGAAVRQNFIALLATNYITGYVRDSSNNPIVGVSVYATATFNSTNYQAGTHTDSSGNYSLNVTNGFWSVGVSCSGGDSSSLDGILGSGNYNCPPNLSTNVASGGAVVNFIVQPPTLDVLSYYLVKERDFFQTDATTLIPNPGYGPFTAYLGIVQTTLGSVPTANVTLPTSAGRGLPAGNTAIELQFSEAFADQASMDVTYPTGNYTFNLFTLNNGNKFPVLNLPTSVYPNTPRVSNYPAAQTINASNSFVLQWDAFAGGTTNETIQFLILDGAGNQLFSSPNPGTDFANSLKGTATSFTIPANTIQSGSNYLGVLIFMKTLSTNLTDYPGAIGKTIASANTTFAMTTTLVLPLQVTTTSLPNGTNGLAYNQSIQATGGQPPYSWAIPNYSADPPVSLIFATNGVLAGTLATSGGPFYFDVAVTDGAANTAYRTLSLTIINPPLPPLGITNVALPNGNVGAIYSVQLGATGGQVPYGNWQLAVGSAALPAGLGINSSGLISGTPTTNKVSTFKVQVADFNSTTTNKILAITINPKPVLSVPTWVTNRFQMRLTGATGQNYTVQTSTNLSLTNWISVLVTNSAATNSFIVTDPAATNKQRSYRVLIGP